MEGIKALNFKIKKSIMIKIETLALIIEMTDFKMVNIEEGRIKFKNMINLMIEKEEKTTQQNNIIVLLKNMMKKDVPIPDKENIKMLKM